MASRPLERVRPDLTFWSFVGTVRCPVCPVAEQVLFSDDARTGTWQDAFINHWQDTHAGCKITQHDRNARMPYNAQDFARLGGLYFSKTCPMAFCGDLTTPCIAHTQQQADSAYNAHMKRHDEQDHNRWSESISATSGRGREFRVLPYAPASPFPQYDDPKLDGALRGLGPRPALSARSRASVTASEQTYSTIRSARASIISQSSSTRNSTSTRGFNGHDYEQPIPLDVQMLRNIDWANPKCPDTECDLSKYTSYFASTSVRGTIRAFLKHWNTHNGTHAKLSNHEEIEGLYEVYAGDQGHTIILLNNDGITKTFASRAATPLSSSASSNSGHRSIERTRYSTGSQSSGNASSHQRASIGLRTPLRAVTPASGSEAGSTSHRGSRDSLYARNSIEVHQFSRPASRAASSLAQSDTASRPQSMQSTQSLSTYEGSDINVETRHRSVEAIQGYNNDSSRPPSRTSSAGQRGIATTPIADRAALTDKRSLGRVLWPHESSPSPPAPSLEGSRHAYNGAESGSSPRPTSASINRQPSPFVPAPTGGKYATAPHTSADRYGAGGKSSRTVFPDLNALALAAGTSRAVRSSPLGDGPRSSEHLHAPRRAETPRLSRDRNAQAERPLLPSAGRHWYYSSAKPRVHSYNDSDSASSSSRRQRPSRWNRLQTGNREYSGFGGLRDKAQVGLHAFPRPGKGLVRQSVMELVRRVKWKVRPNMKGARLRYK